MTPWTRAAVSAASTAFPPSRRTPTPSSTARGCGATTIPAITTSGRSYQLSSISCQRKPTDAVPPRDSVARTMARRERGATTPPPSVGEGLGWGLWIERHVLTIEPEGRDHRHWSCKRVLGMAIGPGALDEAHDVLTLGRALHRERVVQDLHGAAGALGEVVLQVVRKRSTQVHRRARQGHVLD